MATATDEYMADLGLENNATNNYELFGDTPYVYDLPPNPIYHSNPPSNPNEVWIPHDAGMLRVFTILFEYNLI